MVDMKHLEFLETVRAADVATLREKEATYQGSWKAAGGRSAWFMMRRNMDRLMVMMAPPPRPEGFNVQGMLRDDSKDGTIDGDITYLRKSYTAEDIFAKIEEKPAGEDGTVLACVRDLRCYLTLIEAEMMARGVVTPGVRVKGVIEITGEFGDIRDLTDRQITNVVHGRDKDDDGEFTASSMGRAAPHYAGRDGVVIEIGDRCYMQSPSHAQPVIVTLSQVTWNGEPQVSFGMSMIITKWRYLTKITEKPKTEDTHCMIDRGIALNRTFAEDEIRPATPEDGGQHECVFPWAMTHGKMIDWLLHHTSEVQERISAFYKRRTPDLHILEEAIEFRFNAEAPAVPSTLEACYTRTISTTGVIWIIRVDNIPQSCREFYPVLLHELNNKQFEDLPKWQRMLYHWSDSAGKFLINTDAVSWTREA